MHAATYWEPSIQVSAIYDDNVFVRPTVIEDDVITRLRPSIEIGHESERSAARLFYSQDIERYERHPELDSGQIRRQIDGSALYEFSERTAVSLDAGLNESRVTTDLNVNTGFGAGRIEGKRASVNPAIAHRFSENVTGLAELTLIRDRVDNGVGSNTDQINVEFRQFLSQKNQLLYGYRYSRFGFDGEDISEIQVPMLGLVHRLNENRTLTMVAGPRFSDTDSTSFDAALRYEQEYGRGRFMLAYERGTAALIGERGIVDLDVVRSELSYEFTARMQVGAVGSYSHATRDLAEQSGAEVYRAGINAAYRFNDHILLESSWSYSHQRTSINQEQFRIPRNVALFSVTFLLPRTSEPRPRLQPQARAQML